MHIIPSTKEEGISKKKAISLKYQNKEDMKGRERMKGEINYTKVDKKYRTEEARRQQWRRKSRPWCSIWEWVMNRQLWDPGWESEAISPLCVILTGLKVISYHHKDSPLHFCKTASQEDTPLSIRGLSDTRAVPDRCLTSGLLYCPGMIWYTGWADWAAEGWIPKTGHS